MSCIEYSQRLLNAGLLTPKELPAILSGEVSEQALRERFGKQPPDTHPARSAVLQAAKGVSGIEQETTAYADYAELFTASLTRFLRLSSLIIPSAVDAAVFLELYRDLAVPFDSGHRIDDDSVGCRILHL